MKNNKVQFAFIIFFISVANVVFACESVKETKQSLDKEANAMCAAYADGTQAIFLFPLMELDKWVWNRKETSENALEYSWNVNLCDNSNISFGVYLFKFPGSKEKSGTLHQLIKDTQFTVLAAKKKSKSINFRENQNLKIIAGVLNGGVSVGVVDQSTYKELFSKKPEFTHMTMSGPYLEKAITCKVKIEYENKNPERLPKQDKQ